MLTTAGRADQAQVLQGGDPLQAGEVVEGGGVIVDTVRSNSSRVLMTGNVAVLSRVRALEASRAAISASIRVRSSSSGAHRWVFAVHQQFRGELPHRGELEPAQPVDKVGGQRWRGGAHDG